MGMWYKDETKVRCDNVSFRHLMLWQKLEELFKNLKDSSASFVILKQSR